MKYIVGVIFLFFMVTMLGTAHAQITVQPTPAPAFVAPPLDPINFSTQGLVATVLFLVFGANIILSAVRKVLYKYDGVKEGDTIPLSDSCLSLVNKVCLILGQILDFLGSNTKH